MFSDSGTISSLAEPAFAPGCLEPHIWTHLSELSAPCSKWGQEALSQARSILLLAVASGNGKRVVAGRCNDCAAVSAFPRERPLVATESLAFSLGLYPRLCGAPILLYFSLRLVSARESSRSRRFSVLPLPRRELQRCLRDIVHAQPPVRHEEQSHHRPPAESLASGRLTVSPKLTDLRIDDAPTRDQLPSAISTRSVKSRTYGDAS